MTPELIQYLTGAGVVGLIGLVLRIDRKVAFQNGSVARVLEEFEQHKENDREDFRRVFDKIEALR